MVKARTAVVDPEVAGHYSRRGVGGNPKGSYWSKTPRSARVRKKVEISLSDEARAILELLAEARFKGNKSATVEALLQASMRRAMKERTPSEEMRASAKVASETPPQSAEQPATPKRRPAK